jgi:hypothetical protein
MSTVAEKSDLYCWTPRPAGCKSSRDCHIVYSRLSELCCVDRNSAMVEYNFRPCQSSIVDTLYEVERNCLLKNGS